MKKVFHLTKQGKVDLEKELKELVDSRGAVADEIATARENGDLSENAEYTAAREKQGRVETRIAEIENILANAQIIESDGDGTVSLGDSVIVSLDGKESTFSVVGAIEADPMANKISFESPLGKALMGKKAGDKVSITTPKGEKVYQIVKVN
ncbi:MAG: transcription elongation factor GreA [Candidatus Saccharibacteria bacterium]|nr:transcription elongation factor GreA [Candidatus Saccharibacteria bacterium]